MRRTRTMHLAWTSLAVLLWGCAEGSRPAVPARVKLVDLPKAELLPGPVGSEETLLAEDFAGGASAWMVSTSAAEPLVVQRGMLRVGTGSEDGSAHLTLAGRRGAVYRIVPVEPAATYRLSARVRARGLVPASEPFFGAAIWAAEATRSGDSAELLADGLAAATTRIHSFPTAHGGAGWQEQERIIRTGAETRALIVACILGLSEEVESGEVDFRELLLERVPGARHWDGLMARSLADRSTGEPPSDDWRGQRVVRAQLGAEVRPSIVCYPGETVRFSLRLPSAGVLFESGVGAWPAALLPGGGRAQRFVVTVEGEEVLRLEHDAPELREELRWREVAIDLDEHAGEAITLELRVEGDLPGVFGAPLVRDPVTPSDVLNVLLISIDTLRADKLGSYGYEGGTTPRLDAFAAEGIRFAHVVAQAPYTLPAHASLFSGQFPTVHGVQRPGFVLSSTRSPILARILGARSYRTQAFTGGGYVNADFGFDKGFDGFANIDPLRDRDSPFFDAIVEDEKITALQRLRRAGEAPTRVTRELVDEFSPERVHGWLREHEDEPFFLFVHTYTVHDYDSPAEYRTCRDDGCTSTRKDYWEFNITRGWGWTKKPVTDVDREHIHHLYDASLRFTDRLVGELLDVLDETGLRDETIVVITTDHGEELFERGFVQHGKTLYEELTDIPLIIRVPGLVPRVIDAPAMTVDVTPTILGALGIPREARMQGLDLLAGDPGPRIQWSEVDDDFVHKYALHLGTWKLLHAPEDEDVEFPAEHEWELFDLAQDRAEGNDLTQAAAERAEAMRATLRQHREVLRALATSLGETGMGELDEETLRQLQELGYL